MNEPIAVFNVLVVGITIYVSYRGFSSSDLQEKHLFSTADVLRHGEYYRLLSCGLVHANWSHLLFNMFSLYSFGSRIEVVFGAPIFFLVYLSGIAGGNLVALYLHRHHEYHAVGASGGVCGIVFSSIFLLPGGSVRLLLLPIPMPSWLYAVLFIVVSFYGIRTQMGNIGHDAHLGGAVVGLLVTTLLRPTIVYETPFLYVCVTSLSIIALLYCYKNPLGLEGTNPLSISYWQDTWNDFRSAADSRRREADEQFLDQLLKKISESGTNSLTASEKKKLKAISQRKKGER